ncbi:MAG TPA: hypothetical protein VKE50_00050 [Thermoanaerobaculia bacterium]|nr:hypothetical protein [Thermoanaerobaculia bacterium]
MRAYVATAGSIFGLIAVLHVFRMYREHVASMEFLVLTALAAGLAIWAFLLLRRSVRR